VATCENVVYTIILSEIGMGCTSTSDSPAKFQNFTAESSRIKIEFKRSALWRMERRETYKNFWCFLSFRPKSFHRYKEASTTYTL